MKNTPAKLHPFPQYTELIILAILSYLEMPCVYNNKPSGSQRRLNMFCPAEQKDIHDNIERNLLDENSPESMRSA
jgi:hypothetical protein